MRRLLCVIAVLSSLQAVSFSQAMNIEFSLGGNLQQPVPLEACNTTAAEYAPVWDPITSMLCFTSEQSGVAAIYLFDFDSLRIAPAAGTFNSSSEQRAFVTFTSRGEGYGVAYKQHVDQTYASIVTVARKGATLNIGTECSPLNGAFFVSHPAVSPDGLRMVMVSNKPGGTGGLDLWTTELGDDLRWSAPQPLRKTVNTTADEITPRFISADTLIFASNGHGGQGGFDVFYTVYRNGNWQEPVPMDWINTEFDESDCAVLPNGWVVFASTRPGGKGALDLWIAKRE